MPSKAPRLLALMAALLVAAPAIGALPLASARPAVDDTLSDAELYRAWRHLSERRSSPDFARELERAAPGTSVDAIAQFRGNAVTAADVEQLGALGIEVVRAYHMLPAFQVRGEASALRELLDYERLFFLEPNRQVLFDQDTSTTVVNASLVWETRVLGAENFPEGIDGRGVTIVVVDTGIDAGHPDLDYGAKVVANYQETVPGVWTSFENTDTNYGHGTHVAGTVAGNGEASAGARRGVAPGASLIGLTVTLADTAGYLSALEWIYDHSRPGDNPFNIRGHTNSWHTTVAEYDPEAALCQAIEALAFENNVMSTWSAGNDGRTDPQGATITTSGQGNTPVAIMVAAYTHDGSAVADFSSRGQVGLTHTYPDVGAPGVQIWSTSARRTLISSGTYTGGNTNPYYLAISGTSMSTPHTAGAAALLWQAAPSMKISERHEDYNGSDPDGWAANPLTRIHETEWILQATARYLPPDGAHGNVANDTQMGMDGQPHDYVQGYGIIDTRRAVAVALTLEKLRRDNPGREVSVADALRQEAGTQYFAFATSRTDRLYTGWQGEYGRFTDFALNILSTANQTKLVYVPPGTASLEVELNFVAVDFERKTLGDLTWAVDFNRDGTNDMTGPLTPAPPGGHKTGTIAVPGERQGTAIAINVVGNGVKIQTPLRDHVYAEWRSHYTMGVTALLDNATEGVTPVIDRGNYSSTLAPWSFVGPDSEGMGEVSLNQSYLDIRAATLAPAGAAPPGGGLGGAGLLLLALLLLIGAGAAVVARQPAIASRLERLPGGPAAVRGLRRVNEAAMRAIATARRAVLKVRRAKV